MLEVNELLDSGWPEPDLFLVPLKDWLLSVLPQSSWEDDLGMGLIGLEVELRELGFLLWYASIGSGFIPRWQLATIIASTSLLTEYHK